MTERDSKRRRKKFKARERARGRGGERFAKCVFGGGRKEGKREARLLYSFCDRFQLGLCLWRNYLNDISK